MYVADCSETSCPELCENCPIKAKPKEDRKFKFQCGLI